LSILTRSDIAARMKYAIASLVALAACSSSNAAAADLVGPFDITQHTFDLTKVFPEGTLTLLHEAGKPDSVIVEEHRFRVAQIELRDGTPTIATIRIFFEVSKARFEDAHPGTRCNNATLTCTSDQYPNRSFFLGADRTTMVSIAWQPPPGTMYELTSLPSRVATETP